MNLSRYSFLLLVLLSFSFGYSQTDITTTIQLDPQLDSELKTRLPQALQRSGIVIDTLSDILLGGELMLGREGQIEGNATRHVISYDLLLEGRLSGSGAVFHTSTIRLTGTGSSSQQARQAALRQLQANNRSVRNASEQLKIDYQRVLAENCIQLLLQADQLQERQQLLTALALADGIPMGSPCYAQARSQRLSYYQSYQQQYCAEHLEQARRQIALEKPQAALDEITKIDVNSPCAAEARTLLEEAAVSLKDQQAAKAQFLRQVYQNQVAVETARTQAISGLIEKN